MWLIRLRVMYVKSRVAIDLVGQPTVTADSDHCFSTCWPSVHPWRDCGPGRVDHWWHLSCTSFILYVSTGIEENLAIVFIWILFSWHLCSDNLVRCLQNQPRRKTILLWMSRYLRKQKQVRSLHLHIDPPGPVVIFTHGVRPFGKTKPRYMGPSGSQ